MNGFDISSISGIYVGNTEYSKIYYGSTQIWTKEQEEPLPEGVIPVQFIQSTGSQWINTGTVLSNNQNNKLIITCKSTDNNGNYKWIMGCKGGNKQSVFAFANSSGSLYTEISGTNWTSNDYKFIADTVNTIELNSTSIIFNGSSYTHGGSFVSSGNEIAIFACKQSEGLYDNKFIGKVYSAQIYDNNVLVRDLIPVRIGTSGYLYDKINKETLTNTSGTFIAGQELKQNINSNSSSSQYVLNGLIFQLDCINNNDSQQSYWTDLINGIKFTQTGCEEHIKGGGYYFQSSSILDNIDSVSSIFNISTDNYTVEICYKPETSSNKYFIFGTGGQYSHNPMFINYEGNITWGQSSHIYKDTYIINNSKNTVSLNADRCIQNGTEISPESNTDYWDRSDDKFFRMGRSLSTSSQIYENPFSGYIYSIRIYNRKLTKAEQLQNQQVDNSRFNLGLNNL